MVNGPSPGPAPAAQAWVSSSRLTRSNWRTRPHRKLRRKVPRPEGPQGGWRLDYAAESVSRPAGAQRIGVVDAVAARQRRRHQRHNLVARVGSARGIAQVEALLDQLGQTQVLGQRGG